MPLVGVFRQVKDELVGFAAQGETISFVKAAFQATAQTALNLKGALVPLLSGLRDIASVGLAFVRDMSAGAEGLTQRFADWAKTNRENGNLMKWMKDAVQGVKDLWSGLKDATKALWSLLTLFKRILAIMLWLRFADSMKKFNDAVNKSKAGGILRAKSVMASNRWAPKNLRNFGTFSSILEKPLKKSFRLLFRYQSLLETFFPGSEIDNRHD